MEYKNYLESLKDLVKQAKAKFEKEHFIVEKNNNKDENMKKKYEVETDGTTCWIELETLEEIFTHLSFEQQEELKQYFSMISGEEIIITRKFVDFVLDNTYKPQYIPQYVLVRTRTRKKDIFKGDDSDDLTMDSALTKPINLDEEPEIEMGYHR